METERSAPVGASAHLAWPHRQEAPRSPPSAVPRSSGKRHGHGKVSSVSSVTGRFKRNREFLVILRGGL